MQLNWRKFFVMLALSFSFAANAAGGKAIGEIIAAGGEGLKAVFTKFLAPGLTSEVHRTIDLAMKSVKSSSELSSEGLVKFLEAEGLADVMKKTSDDTFSTQELSRLNNAIVKYQWQGALDSLVCSGCTLRSAGDSSELAFKTIRTIPEQFKTLLADIKAQNKTWDALKKSATGSDGATISGIRPFDVVNGGNKFQAKKIGIKLSSSLSDDDVMTIEIMKRMAKAVFAKPADQLDDHQKLIRKALEVRMVKKGRDKADVIVNTDVIQDFRMVMEAEDAADIAGVDRVYKLALEDKAVAGNAVENAEDVKKLILGSLDKMADDKEKKAALKLFQEKCCYGLCRI